ncbi:MAG: hypothetical protein KTR13_03635, partial [Saprospiraceae bacterium]|nr:hypothetical protein [Saprospiraceae bacterium]
MRWRGINMTLLLVFAGIPVFAQLCQGNFSEPVFAEDFGQRGNTGATYGPPLAPGETTYNYFAGPNVQDGSYTITDNPVNALSVFHSVQDRTPDDINGYMMVVNSDFDPGEFYRKRVTGLCENTLFEFSAWVLNVLPDNNNCGPNSILPNIRFEVRSTAGALIAFAETGNVQETVSPQWVQYGVAFTTDASTTEVDVVMFNNAPGGCGNDLAIDDIEFRACGDVAEIASISGNGEFCDDAVPASLGLEANLS